MAPSNLDLLLGVSTKSNARELLLARRPQSDRRFSGDEENSDYESFIQRFERHTHVEGVDDEMRLIEVQHWVKGTAEVIASSYEDVADAGEALRQIKAHWRREFGKRVYTANQLLEKHLKGGPFKQENAAGIRAFICGLEAVYRRAGSGPRRAKLFDNPEVMNDILRRRLPTFSKKWAQKLNDLAVRQAEWDGENVPDLTFVDFLAYLTRSNGIQLHEAAIHKRSSSTTVSPPAGSGAALVGSQRSWRYATRVAAAELAPVGEEFGEDVDSADAFCESSSASSGGVPEVAGISVAAATSSRPRSKVKSPRPQPSDRAAQSSNRMLPPSSSYSPAPDAGGSRKCVGCGASGREYHPLYNCRSFLRRSEPERQTLVQENHVCRLCLEQGHYARWCQSQGRCADSSEGQACGGRHHTLMHTVRGAMGPPAPMVTH